MTQPFSGSVEGGFRVLPIQKTQEYINLEVYRGDYVKFKVDESLENTILLIAALSINQALPRKFSDSPYFKMKTTGILAMTLGEIHGNIADSSAF